VREIYSRRPLLSSSSASLYLIIRVEDHLHFIILFNIFEVLITNLMQSSSPISIVYYILRYLRVDVRRYLVHNVLGIVIYFAFYEYVLSLKMVFIA